MRVLMVSREYPPFVVGGTGVHTGYLVKHLRKLGVDVKAIAFGNPKYSNDEVSFIETRSSILVRGKTAISSDVRVLEDIVRLTKCVGAEARREHYDLIHVQEPYVGGLISYHKRKVTTIHDTSFGEIRGYVKYPTMQSFKRIMFYIGLGYEMEFLSISSSKIIIAPSYDVVWELLKVYGIPMSKIRLIPNGVEDPQDKVVDREYARELLNLPKDVVIVYSTGQHIGRKRFCTIIRAARLLKSMDLKNVFILIGGEGPLTPYLKKLAEELDVSNLVRFIGWVPEAHLSLYYRAADVFVITSEYEAGPLTMLEAGIRGIPLVVSDVPSGFMTLARDGIDCLKFKVGDPADLAEKLKVFIENPDLRRKFGEKAVEFASKFRWSKIAEKTVEVYREVVG